mmetsp:Transcript_774/g.1829  ORF Transcript_774/g.1829 Transcript_774/m.1829 type:complete len:233 (-) Transcript_774:1588-2286(-)
MALDLGRRPRHVLSRSTLGEAGPFRRGLPHPQKVRVLHLHTSRSQRSVHLHLAEPVVAKTMPPGHFCSEEDYNIVRTTPGIDCTAGGIGVDDSLGFAFCAGNVAGTTYIHPINSHRCTQIHTEHPSIDMHNKCHPVSSGRQDTCNLPRRPCRPLLHRLLVFVQRWVWAEASEDTAMLRAGHIRSDEFPGLQGAQTGVVTGHHAVTNTPHQIAHFLKAQCSHTLLIPSVHATR